MNKFKHGGMTQTPHDLNKHLNEQIEFLSASTDSFDLGVVAEAKRMSLHLRIIFYDTPKSHSILSQLGTKAKLQMLDTRMPAGTLGPYMGLILKGVGKTGARYVAPLDDMPPNVNPSYQSFDDWWNAEILIDDLGNRFSRSDIVLFVAHEDGGAHVDPKLSERYAALSRANSLGWNFVGQQNGQTISEVVTRPVEATLRQISHEALKTLIKDYPHKKMVTHGLLAIFGDIIFSEGAMPRHLIQGSTKEES